MKQVEVTIENTGVNGQGVGKTAEGKVLFVPGALPGDRVRLEYEESESRFADARLLELLEPGSRRTDPVCPVFQACGGCDWLDWEYAAQLEAKQKTLLHTLARAGLAAEQVGEFLPSVTTTGFRTRIQVRQSGERVGFYKRRSHEIVDVESCLVAHPALNRAIADLRAEPVVGERKVELWVERGATGESVARTVDAAHGQEGFTQGNAAQNERLREVVAREMTASGAQHVLELFCGDGNLTVAYAPRVQSVRGIDGNPAAIAKARARAAPPARHRFETRSIDGALASQLARKFGSSYDTLLVDPPRKGMGGSLKSFLFGRIRTLIYVSCSPVAFSKDVRGIADLGFTLKTVQGVDMFPHTHHIEFVARFSRSV